MDLTNYAGLQGAIASFLNRADLTAQVPAFISLAEARFNRELRVNAMAKRDYTKAVTDYIQLPKDWLEHNSLVVTQPPTVHRAMDYVSQEEFNDLRKRGLTGAPQFYTIIGDSIAMLPRPTGSTTFEITYYQKIPALSDAQPTNWLLDRSPDLYLYASLLNAEPYLMNDERVPLWTAAVGQAMEAMRMESERASRPRGALRARLRTFG